MTKDLKYVPILKAKLGEISAVSELKPSTQDQLTPLFEVPPLPRDPDTDEPTRTINDHVDGLAPRLAVARGERRLFIDAYPLDNEEIPEGSRQPIAQILHQARDTTTRFVPVVGMTRPSDFVAAVADAIATDRHGVCIRLTPDDYEMGSLSVRLGRLLETVGVTPTEADLILDLGPVIQGSEDAYRQLAEQCMLGLPHLTSWRTLTLAASSFPSDLSGCPRNQLSSLPRIEWRIYQTIRAGAGDLRRMPAFGDYAINHPDFIDLDFRTITRSAQIRYTHDTEWIIVKGRGIVKGSSPQEPGLAGRLISEPVFAGRGLSWGDGYIEDCAGGSVGPGNATKWRQVGVNHHLEHVVADISSHGGI